MDNMRIYGYLSKLQNRTLTSEFAKARDEFQLILLKHFRAIDTQIVDVKVNWVFTTYSELAGVLFKDGHSSVDLIYRDEKTVNINTNRNSFLATYKQIEKYLKEKATYGE